MRRHRPYNHPSIRSLVWDMTDGRCAYCGVQTNPFRDFTVDHIMPRCQGGTDDLTNLLPCCAACNSAKGGMDPQRWLKSRRTWLGSDEFRATYFERLGEIQEVWVRKIYGSWDNWRAGIEVR